MDFYIGNLKNIFLFEATYCAHLTGLESTYKELKRELSGHEVIALIEV